jgi:hypothetical protein
MLCNYTLIGRFLRSLPRNVMPPHKENMDRTWRQAADKPACGREKKMAILFLAVFRKER